MGCDIHAFVEYDVDPEYTFTFAEVHLGRWYRMFGELVNGLRGEGGAYAPEARGWPADVGDAAKDAREKWHGDGHSFSWCTHDEFVGALARAILAHDDSATRPIPADWRAVGAALELLPNARLVFFFDN